MKVKKNVFRIFLFLFPFFILFLLEVILRLSNYGDDISIVAQVERNGKKYFTLNQFAGKRYFDEDRLYFRKGSHDFFEINKQPNTVRVFCFGASTTAGFPYEYNAIPSEFLRDRLVTALPGKNIEVINTAIAATNSFTVSEFTNELSEYEPDLFIVYMGQNEFYGAFGVGSTISAGKSRWMIKSYLWLLQFKTFQLLKDGITAAAGLFGSTDAPEDNLLMEQMAENNSIDYNSDDFNTALSSFNDNYREIIENAKKKNIPVIISTLVTNERDLPPFVSLHSSALSDDDLKKTKVIYELATSSMGNGEYEWALEYLQQAIATDPSNAIYHYSLAKCYEALGNIDEAKISYIFAKDLDGLRFRAPSDFNKVVREISKDYNVPLADVEKCFRDNSPVDIIGSELLVDHLHPDVNGYFLLAKSWFDAIKNNNLLSLTPGITQNDSLLWQRSTVTRLDSTIGTYKILKLKSGPPFKKVKEEFEVTTYDFVEDIAFDYAILNKFSWGEAHLNAAKEYLDRNDLISALNEYRAISVADDSNPFIIKMTGDTYYSLNMFAQAEENYLRALTFNDNNFIKYKLGLTNLALQKPAVAIQYLQECLNRRNESQRFTSKETEDIHYNLAVAFAQLGKQQNAENHLKILLRLNPRNEQAQALLRKL